MTTKFTVGRAKKLCDSNYALYAITTVITFETGETVEVTTLKDSASKTAVVQSCASFGSRCSVASRTVELTRRYDKDVMAAHNEYVAAVVDSLSAAPVEAAASALDPAPVSAESKVSADLKFVQDPATVLWALCNPEGWTADTSSVRTPCITGFRALTVDGEVVEIQQTWVACEYESLAATQAAMSQAASNADQIMAERYAVRTGLATNLSRVPGITRISTTGSGSLKLLQLRENCAWLPYSEAVGFPFSSGVAA